MYEAFFGLKEKPFSLVPDPNYLYLSRRHQAAINMLELALKGQAGFSTITGEIGSGKTTVARRFLEMASDNTTIGLITNTHEDLGDLLEWILLAFGLEQKGKNKIERYETFVDFLFDQFAKGHHTVLLIDEAQNLSVSALEQLRVFSNIYDDQEHVLQIILVGQPELLEKLNRPELKQLAQRISVNFHLGPLNVNETAAYIRHRLAVAGAQHSIFDEAASAAVYFFTGGIPRLINVVCDFALLYAYADERGDVDYETIWQVICDKRQTGLHVFENTERIGDREYIFGEILKLSTEINIAEAPIQLGSGDDRQKGVSPEPMGEVVPTGEKGVPRKSSTKTAKAQRIRTAEGLKVAQVSGPNGGEEAKQSKQPVDDENNGPIELTEPAEHETGRSAMRIAIAAALVILVIGGAVLAWVVGRAPGGLLAVEESRKTDVSGHPNDSAAVVSDLPPSLESIQDSGSPAQREPNRSVISEPAVIAEPTASISSENVQKVPSLASIKETSEGPDGAGTKPPDRQGTMTGQGTPLLNLSQAKKKLSGYPKTERADARESDGAAASDTKRPMALTLLGLFTPEEGSAAVREATKTLLSLWGYDKSAVPGQGPCQEAAEVGLTCLVEAGSLQRLAAYDRPAIINFRSAQGKLIPAVLSALDGKTATLRMPGRTVVAKVAEIAPFVSGDHTVFWKAPDIYYRALQEGMRGKDVAWLRRRLIDLEIGVASTDESDLFDASLTRQVMEFQRVHGLDADGIVGPRTIMNLTAAIGAVSGPRLKPNPAQALRHEEPRS